MGRLSRLLFLLVAMLLQAKQARPQLPFYTDDPAVTPRGTLHFESFNEYDVLQSSEFPDLHQNTANFKVNYGLPHNLELDLDAPYLAVFRATGVQSSKGIGDTDLGIKWEFCKPPPGSRHPALGASFYVEFPTGNTKKQLSSGLTDYWLNFDLQQPLSGKTRINANFGYLFAGNTSTGALGITTTRGHVFAGGLSVLHDFTPRLTLGIEAFGGASSNDALGRSQLQFLAGGQYVIRNGLALSFGLLGGKYTASPRIGGQIGFSMDFPGVFRRPTGHDVN
jgi:outer membrane putative beta-barrel porin/alpha-amylase